MPTIEKNWEKWLEIEAQVRRWVLSRWWNPAAAEDVVQEAACLFVAGKPNPDSELGYAKLKCREAARNLGLWSPGKVREIATDPADMLEVEDCRNPESMMIDAQGVVARTTLMEQAEQMIRLLAPEMAEAVVVARDTSMAAACRSVGIPQRRLSEALGRVGRAISGRPRSTYRPRQSRAAKVATGAVQLRLGLA